MIKKHFLGSYSQDLPGHQILCMAGMHGNEHAGITAAQRVLKSLEVLQTPYYGSISFLPGTWLPWKNSNVISISTSTGSGLLPRGKLSRKISPLQKAKKSSFENCSMRSTLF